MRPSMEHEAQPEGAERGGQSVSCERRKERTTTRWVGQALPFPSAMQATSLVIYFNALSLLCSGSSSFLTS